MAWEVFFDVETKKLFNEITTTNPGDLGVSIVSVYRREIDKSGKEIHGVMTSFWENEFENMWKLFLEADRIIGFNTLKFDVPALLPYSPGYFAKLNHFDIMDQIYQKLGHRISLAALARDTLGAGKTASGIEAVDYWNLGDEESLRKLRTYCEADVILTRDLYNYGRENRFLKYTDKWNNPLTVEVNFSYPETVEAGGKQTSLW